MPWWSQPLPEQPAPEEEAAPNREEEKRKSFRFACFFRARRLYAGHVTAEEVGLLSRLSASRADRVLVEKALVSGCGVEMATRIFL